jgi:hypothetical protein
LAVQERSSSSLPSLAFCLFRRFRALIPFPLEQIAKAMGAEVYALSHSDRKLADAEKLGCKKENFIIAKDKEATKAKWSRSFDVRLFPF